MKLWYRQCANNWNEALPVGNGRLGGMVYSRLGEEIIALNEETLWTGAPADCNRYGAASWRPEIERLSREGKLWEAQQLIDKHMMGCWGEKYQPLGDLLISLPPLEGGAYRRELDLQSAVVSTVCEGYESDVFVSAPLQALVYHGEFSVKGDMSFRLEGKNCAPGKLENGVYKVEGRCPPRVMEGVSPDLLQGIAYETWVYPLGKYEGISCQNGRVTLRGAVNITLLVFCRSSFHGWDKSPYLDGADYRSALAEDLNGARGFDYPRQRLKHIRDYRSYFDRCSIAFAATQRDDLPTDQRLRLLRDGSCDPGLYRLLFDFGRYLLISSSRESTMAANLQGIWNREYDPPWSSSYTTNINVEMNYWPALMTNLAPMHRPYVELMKIMAVQGKKTAKAYYNAPGFCAHVNFDIWGMTSPVAEFPQASYFPFCGAWIVRDVWERYQYTLDERELREEGYPLLRDAALFCLDVMTQDENGWYVVCPSTSPEHRYHKDGHLLAIAKATTASLSIIRDLFGNVLKAAGVLGIDDAFTREVARRLPLILPYRVGSEGQILEWCGEEEDLERDHRHISHLYSLHPAKDISPVKTPRLAQACKRSLEMRGDDGTGWALAWKALQWTRLRDGEHAFRLLNRFLCLVETQETIYENNGGVYQNLFCAHPPFQIDGNFGITAMLTEMLVQWEDDDIYLLPALPQALSEGNASGIVLGGGLVVSFAWENGKIKRLSIASPLADCERRLHMDGQVMHVGICKGGCFGYQSEETRGR